MNKKQETRNKIQTMWNLRYWNLIVSWKLGFGTSSNAGFTLIELLIVIAIIGILSTLLMTNFIGIRQRARDAQRKSDVRQIQSALELYRSDTGTYPPEGGTNRLNSAACPTPSSFTYSGSTYMQKIPCDPLGNTYYHVGSYYYDTTGTTYTLAACLENSADTDSTSSFAGGDSACTSGVYYTKNNP